MLEAYIIKEILNKENQKRKYSQQPLIPMPIEIDNLFEKVPHEQPPEEKERGVVIIEM